MDFGKKNDVTPLLFVDHMKYLITNTNTHGGNLWFQMVHLRVNMIYLKNWVVSTGKLGMLDYAGAEPTPLFFPYQSVRILLGNSTNSTHFLAMRQREGFLGQDLNAPWCRVPSQKDGMKKERYFYSETCWQRMLL